MPCCSIIGTWAGSALAHISACNPLLRLARLAARSALSITPCVQDAAERARQADKLVVLANAATASTSLAVTVAGSGLLGVLLQAAAELAGAGEGRPQEQVGSRRAMCGCVLLLRTWLLRQPYSCCGQLPGQPVN